MVIKACPTTCPSSSFHRIKDKRNRKITGETTSYANSPSLFSCYLYSAIPKGDKINPHVSRRHPTNSNKSGEHFHFPLCCSQSAESLKILGNNLYNIIKHVLQLDTCVCIAEPLCCPLETITKLLTNDTPMQN